MWPFKKKQNPILARLAVIEDMLSLACSRKCESINIINAISDIIDNKNSELIKIISEKYIDSINSLLDWHKEIGTVMYLTGVLGVDDITRLKRIVQQPILEKRWLETKAMDADRVNKLLDTKGSIINRRKKEIYDKYLALQRQGKDFTDAKAQYDILQELFGP